MLTPRGAIKNEAQCFYYIPILSSLQAVLCREDISKQVAIFINASMYLLVSEKIL